MEKTISATTLLEWCQYEPAAMSAVARRQQVRRLRLKYGIQGIQTPRRGLRFSPAEVRRKVPFITVPVNQPVHHAE